MKKASVQVQSSEFKTLKLSSDNLNDASNNQNIKSIKSRNQLDSDNEDKNEVEINFSRALNSNYFTPCGNYAASKYPDIILREIKEVSGQEERGSSIASVNELQSDIVIGSYPITKFLPLELLPEETEDSNVNTAEFQPD